MLTSAMATAGPVSSVILINRAIYMYMVPVREPLFPLGSRKIHKKVPLQLRINYHILVVCFRMYDLWINKSMVKIANAGTLREVTLRVHTLTYPYRKMMI